LYTVQIQGRLAEQQPAHNIPIEVLVAYQTQHAATSATVLAGKNTTAEVGEVPLVALNALAHFLRPLLRAAR
jgi:hypothetical protein